MRQCESCGGSFYVAPGEGWKRLCLSCWKASKNQRQPANITQIEAERNALEQEVRLLRMALADELRRSQPAAAPIPPDMLSRLVRLCHPDRHGNSEMSVKATQWLLSLRA